MKVIYYKRDRSIRIDGIDYTDMEGVYKEDTFWFTEETARELMIKLGKILGGKK